MSLPRPVKTLISAAIVSSCLIFLLLQYSTWSPNKPNTPGANHQVSIPEKIWYKVGPQDISKEIAAWISTCLEQNPTFDHEILTDSAADAYVVAKFSDRPEVLETYLALTIPILKADLLRYLILFADGGLWSDLDVSCEGIPIREWIPEEYKRNASLVVGWEFETVDVKHMREFVTWMIMAKPGSRHMKMVIDDVLLKLHGKAHENNVTISGLTMSMIGDVVHVTGPMAMSLSIIKSLGIEKLDLNYGRTPYVLSLQMYQDVLILSGQSFSASLQHYKDDEQPGSALVTHHFAGSWKNENGGESGDPTILSVS